MKKNPERIPVEQLTAYERWELPLLDEAGNETPARRKEAEVTEPAVKPLTAAELEDIRQAAFSEGLEDGRKQGFEAGHAEGLQKGHAQGHESGYAEGKAQGQQEGREQAQQARQQEIDTQIKRLESLMEALLEPIRLHEDEIEEALLNLVLAISRAVTQRELQIDSRQIAGVVRDALAVLPSTRENVRLSIHPSDEPWIKPVLDQLQAPAAVKLSESILPGGCKVETQHSLIDFTVEKRFQKVVQQMLDRHISNTAPNETPDLTDAMGEMTDFHTDLLNVPLEPAPPASPKPETRKPAGATAPSPQVAVPEPEQDSAENSPNEPEAGHEPSEPA